MISSRRAAIALLVPFAYVLGSGLAACATHLTAVDVHALGLQVADCEDVTTRLASASDPSLAVARAEARGCVCGARGVLSRARETEPDAGSKECPQ